MKTNNNTIGHYVLGKLFLNILIFIILGKHLGKGTFG